MVVMFTAIDHYVWWTIFQWLRKKHPETSIGKIRKRYGWRKPRGRMLRWRDGTAKVVSISQTRVRPYSLGW